jgi:hypothetical protein
MVRGELMHDPEMGWLGKVDWSTQDVWEWYPPAVAADLGEVKPFTAKQGQYLAL